MNTVTTLLLIAISLAVLNLTIAIAIWARMVGV